MSGSGKRYALRVKAPIAPLLLLLTLAAAPGQDSAPFRPASPAERQARAAVVLGDYRYDDLLWENDRTAHRIYGHRLEAVEPPSGSGIDAWGKSVSWPFMDRQLRTGDQHADHGEGVDFYNVGAARGTGGLGIWYDNKLWTSRNYVRHRILNAGPDVADFSVGYAPWPVGVNRQVSETRRFTLPAGTHFTRMISTLSSNRSEPLVVGIGISRRPTDPTAAGTFTADRATGRFAWWGPTDQRHGTMAAALLVDPAMIVDVKNDSDNHLVLLRVPPGKPFVYYAGAAWDRGADIHTQAEWITYVRAARADFTADHD
ncbi:DUF4861 family protein [Sphingomonas sp. S2-65]|uniref:DUF4861 family protein n=1 Tax=Sphingomonas sp. S2-65 TaxID=2903960 RepID=UPI001F18E54A|nr:DUF4861 family protein [Sphingomonas sp. S2-65]UYY60053.1 DUF4861 domain-containing protein [Sphingomonas sp. S2-65]